MTLNIFHQHFQIKIIFLGRRREAVVVVVGARDVDAGRGRGEDGHRRSPDENRLLQSQPQPESPDPVFRLRRFAFHRTIFFLAFVYAIFVL